MNQSVKTLHRFIAAALLLLFAEAASSAGLMDQSVVLIDAVKQGWDYTTPWKQTSTARVSGTGFVIAGGRILTNAHNVSDVRYVEVKKQNFAKRYPVKVAFIGHDCDLAILTPVDSEFFADMTSLELGGLPEINSKVSTYGYPIGGRLISVTEGVVSRIQMDNYSHPSADEHLVIQTDAAINPGNSGGPVLQNDKVIGVAFQGLRQAENIGYLIPTTVINHFLKDIEDGRYDGFGSVGFSSYPGLHSDSYRQFLKLPAGVQGVVVLHTMLNSSAQKVLQPRDVVTKIGDYDVDNDGMITIYGMQLSMSEAIEQEQIGEKIMLVFYRDGQPQQQEVRIELNRPIPELSRLYDQPPRYAVYGGLVFVAVSRNYVETWGQEWYREIPPELRYLLAYAQELNTDPKRREYVVLSEIMPDAVNAYADPFLHQPLTSINGKDILSLDDVVSSVAQHQDGYQVLRFLDKNRPLILNTAEANKDNPEILKKYQIPAPARLENPL
jgi:S1-C subfamily serine protease